MGRACRGCGARSRRRWLTWIKAGGAGVVQTAVIVD
jgi:hypothetical protein